MTNTLNEDTELLLSRGLDADLDRADMRRLYRLAGGDPAVPGIMGAMAEMEDSLQLLSAAQAEARPERRFAAELAEAQDADRPSRWSQFWHWLRSPHGISVQPLSFAAGVAIAAVAVAVLPPSVLPVTPSLHEASATPRFMVNPVQFVDAKARVEWTYQFIVPAGSVSRVAIDHGDSRPVTFQFESAELTQLRLVHRGPGQRRDLVQSFSVDGVGIASLANPQPGDEVTIHNDGSVPVLVYAHTGKADSGSVSRPL